MAIAFIVGTGAFFIVGTRTFFVSMIKFLAKGLQADKIKMETNPKIIERKIFNFEKIKISIILL
jgi:uncharacterized membrane protein